MMTKKRIRALLLKKMIKKKVDFDDVLTQLIKRKKRNKFSILLEKIKKKKEKKEDERST